MRRCSAPTTTFALMVTTSRPYEPPRWWLGENLGWLPGRASVQMARQRRVADHSIVRPAGKLDCSGRNVQAARSPTRWARPRLIGYRGDPWYSPAIESGWRG